MSRSYNDIGNYEEGYARRYKEDGTLVNFADILDSVYYDGNHDTIVVMDNATKRVLDGDAYSITSKISIANLESAHIEITTGDNNLYVTSVRYSPDDGLIDLVFKEGASISGGNSSSLTAFNENRNSVKTPDSTFTAYDNGATVTGGTIIETVYLPGTGKDAGENFVSGLRFVLKPNTTYVRTISNNSGGTVNIGVGAEFYEFP